MSRPATLGDLRASGWVSQPIKEELRANTVRMLAKGEPLARELADFVGAIRETRAPAVSGRDGRRALELATRVAAAIGEGI